MFEILPQNRRTCQKCINIKALYLCGEIMLIYNRCNLHVCAYINAYVWHIYTTERFWEGLIVAEVRFPSFKATPLLSATYEFEVLDYMFLIIKQIGLKCILQQNYAWAAKPNFRYICTWHSRKIYNLFHGL